VIRFEGSLTALPTPFIGGCPERVDYSALRRLIEFQLASGTTGLVACGSTGEGMSLALGERMGVVELTAGVAASSVPVVATVGAFSTREARDLARTAVGCGADALLLTTPPYLKPTQEGLLTHFEAVADAVEVPLILYNVPGRTAVDLLPATVARLASIPHVVAIQEASGSLQRIRELVALGTVDVLCGEDHMIADCMQSGATGVIGVVSNLVPARVLDLVEASAPGGDAGRAAMLVEQLAPLAKGLFVQPNPAPLKAALEHLGWCSGELRLPLLPVDGSLRVDLERALGALGLNA